MCFGRGVVVVVEGVQFGHKIFEDVQDTEMKVSERR